MTTYTEPPATSTSGTLEVHELEPIERKSDSTIRWLWRFGLVRATLAWTFTLVTLLQAATDLPDPASEQWQLLGVVVAFYFATAGAQGVAAQTANAVRSSDEKEGGAG